jgi:hypothetical protein
MNRTRGRRGDVVRGKGTCAAARDQGRRYNQRGEGACAAAQDQGHRHGQHGEGTGAGRVPLVEMATGQVQIG